MTPDQERILMETRQLAEENNDILRKMQRSQRMGAVMKVLYWLVIIGLSVGAFWFIQPYIDSLKGQVSGLTGLN